MDLRLFRPVPLFAIAIGLRLGLLIYGLWQDAHSALKYTDIDYLVFTDAAAAVANGDSPYSRETYRYTPLLAWLLTPTALSSALLSPQSSTVHPHQPDWRSATAAVLVFSLGKLLFGAADIIAGWMLLRILRCHSRLPEVSAGALTAVWLWNPVVAGISTRGSCEGMLAVLVMALLWAALKRWIVVAAVLLGLAVHFKIYPFIYAFSLIWWMDDERLGKPTSSSASLLGRLVSFVSLERVQLVVVSILVFAGLNGMMYAIYGMNFLDQTFLHHVIRLDHRHNFSPYNVLLYLNSALPQKSSIRIESVAFVPQLLLSSVLIPLVVAKHDLPTAMMAQTFAFVTFNKVCTSQYFIWYVIFLPLYLPRSSFARRPALGVAALVLWVAAQAAWLQQAYVLEFLGGSTFVPGLLLASSAFYLVNCWILGVMIVDGSANIESEERRSDVKTYKVD